MSAGHRNNFDALRFIAAALVWYWHCYALTGRDDPFARFIAFESPGNVGVAMFFIISGYFVTMSYDRHNNLWAYARNRALRILPAMVVVILLSVFVLGPLVSSLGWGRYFHDPETWRYLRSLLIFPLQYNLPGVFTNNLQPAVNGSLWTLQHEVRLYIVVMLLGVLSLLRGRVTLAIVLVLYALRVWGIVVMPDHWAKHELTIELASLFAGGALMYTMRSSIKLSAGYFILACLLLVASAQFPLHFRGAIVSAHPAGEMLFDAAMTYIVIYIGFLRLPLLWRASNRGDFSYGFYLYAYPVQQLVLHLFGVHMPLHLFMLESFAATLLCAILSWHFVEKRALALKSN